MSSAASRKVENQTMEDILTSIRRIIADDQKSAPTVQEKPAGTPKANPQPHSLDDSIEDDILALRSALNAIRGEMDGIQNSISHDDDIGRESVAPEAFFEDEEPEGLLSPQAEHSVRRSFAELSTAASLPPFDIDAAAQALLRPMLQQWLDDNLPTMVERLVREEIARLSDRRG